MAKLLLLFPNHPGYYPHMARHARAFVTLFDEVEVGAVFREGDSLPTVPGVRFFSIVEDLPVGPLGFAWFMSQVRKMILSRNPDAVEAVDPPCLIPAAQLLNKMTFQLIYFSMELFPETPALAKKPLRRWIWSVLERNAARKAQRILTVNASVAQELRNRFGVNQVGVVRSMPFRSPWRMKDNWMRTHFEIPLGHVVLVYQGHLEEGRGLEKIADALLARPQVELVILGLGPMENWARDRAVQQANIHFGGAFPFDELMVRSSGADAGLVWIEPVSESYRISLPGKIFEYVQNSLPMLGSPLPEIRTHILVGEVGEVADDFSKEALLRALDRLCLGIRSNAYSQGLHRARNEWCWEQEQVHLRRAFDLSKKV